VTRRIGLFSGLDPATGGIAVSGRSAWQGVIGQSVADLVCYGGVGPLDGLPRPGRVVESASRYRLAGKLLARSWPADGCVVWHVGLLKLLPFLRGFRGRVVLFLHGIEVWRPVGRLTRRLLDRVDLFLSNSEYTWRKFLTFAPWLSAARHRTVHLGWGEPHVGPTPPSGDVPSAVIVARLAKAEDYKGHRELIRAWPAVRERVPGARLDVVGDGDLRPELERLAGELGVQDGVRFHGRVSEERKADLLAHARCLAMPSRGEGFGIVYAEAMRLGRPCLVSDCDAGREVVNPPECGPAVDPADASGLADALARLLTPGRESDEWSASARRRYEAEFTEAAFHRRLAAGLSDSAPRPAPAPVP
jgi:phosphatidylinositol alpha-1,6-mannosyltransferase